MNKINPCPNGFAIAPIRSSAFDFDIQLEFFDEPKKEWVIEADDVK